jgi:hypothetical protein
MVKARFDAIVASTGGIDWENDFMSDIDKVADLLRGTPAPVSYPGKEHENEPFLHSEAGYLVGVQVGLRLRTAGGVR